MRTILTGAGYRFSDNSESGGAKEENDVLCCPHCQAVIYKSGPNENWRASDGGSGWCGRCNAPICGTCANRALTEVGCTPFVEYVEKLMSDEHRRTQFRKLAGLDPGPDTSFRRFGGRTRS